MASSVSRTTGTLQSTICNGSPPAPAGSPQPSGRALNASGMLDGVEALNRIEAIPGSQTLRSGL
jgi:hypothetical protein